jgi:hypothetical protein
MSTVEKFIVIGAAISTLIYLLTLVSKAAKSWFTFITDWHGTEDRPGVMERLEIGNQRFEKIDEELSIIKAELFANSGSSLRDSVDRIETILTGNLPKKPIKKSIKK